LHTTLRPPCYFVIRNSEPAPASGSVVPVGGRGQIKGFRYRDLKGWIVTALIGDPLDQQSAESEDHRGKRCGQSVQAVLLGKRSAKVAHARKNVGTFCVEAERDEKDFWLLTHPTP
jgi:hypothetical protein